MAGALAALGLVAGAGVGNAGVRATVFADGFEGDMFSRWDRLNDRAGSGGGDFNGGVARTGANNGWVEASRGWGAVRIPVDTRFVPKNSCQASIYANPVGEHDAPGSHVSLEVWNPNGWVKMLETIPYLNNASYQRITTPRFPLYGIDKIYVQVIFGNENGVRKFIRLDDMALECT
ncbi:hypothetical protein JOF53_001017 [Crossiella equi]|uniref:Uncharacterized protein n=1 Tax=Crossiella equi TaxID=130796 RepID=A0ABS5A6B9_9PSEU|nr:hypothetical protein [Crossiella equi]MBP2472145.1 hypothetical protein [Crossiella equi]